MTINNKAASIHKRNSRGVPHMTNLVFQGKATDFDKPFIHGARIVNLKSGCFDASLRENDVSLFLDHKDDARLGTTAKLNPE
jgi:hypothetical protein